MSFYVYTIAVGVLALLFSSWAAFSTLKKPEGTPKMREISLAIRAGSKAYLNRQMMTIAAFGIVLAIIFYFIPNGVQLDIAFATGAIASYATAYIGMNVAVRANVRTAKSAEKGMKHAFETAVIGGSVTGFVAVGFGLISISLLLMYLTIAKVAILIGFGFGASLVSLFARVGGGIYTKAADVGADLVGKTELNLPEDDPRNPAVIADNVGDNVGDCAGMSADVFESYAVTLVAALLIANSIKNASTALFSYPLLIAGLGVIGSLLAMAFMRVRKSAIGALYAGILSAVVISAVLDFALTKLMALPLTYFVAVLAGLVIAILIFWITDYFTGNKSKPVIKIATASKGGAGTNVIMGLAVGLRSTWLPVLVIVGAIFVSYYSVGSVYGIGIAAVGMLSLRPQSSR